MIEALALRSRCRSCGAPIVWLKTTAGRTIPVDAASAPAAVLKLVFDPKAHVSHFATCPDADRRRKKKA